MTGRDPIVRRLLLVIRCSERRRLNRFWSGRIVAKRISPTSVGLICCKLALVVSVFTEAQTVLVKF